MLLQDGGLETDRGLVSILNISETTCFYIKWNATLLAWLG
jgi:hypothetical protein